MPFNGPPRELVDHRAAPGVPGDLEEERVYCVQCGTIYVSAPPKRDCPACTLAEMIESIGDRVEKHERQLHEEGQS